MVEPTSNSVKNPPTYPHNEHRVMWATVASGLDFVQELLEGHDAIGLWRPSRPLGKVGVCRHDDEPIQGKVE